jgi:mRNA interferase MazF
VRPIHLVRLDKTRPALILTREVVRPHLARVTVAPITSRIRGLTVELPVGPSNGFDHDSVLGKVVMNNKGSPLLVTLATTFPQS